MGSTTRHFSKAVYLPKASLVCFIRITRFYSLVFFDNLIVLREYFFKSRRNILIKHKIYPCFIFSNMSAYFLKTQFLGDKLKDELSSKMESHEPVPTRPINFHCDLIARTEPMAIFKHIINKVTLNF